MKKKCFGAFQPAKINPVLLKGVSDRTGENAAKPLYCVGGVPMLISRLFRPVYGGSFHESSGANSHSSETNQFSRKPKSRLSGYSSGGSFLKSVRCLPAALILLAVFLITACGSSGGGGGGGGGGNPDTGTTPSTDPFDIGTYTYAYTVADHYEFGTKYNIPKTSINTIPSAAKATYRLTGNPADTSIDVRTGEITIGSAVPIKAYDFTADVSADTSTEYKGTNSTIIKIHVKGKLNSFPLSYAKIEGKNTGVITKKPSTDIPEGAAIYSIGPTAPAGININKNTGAITIDKGTTAGTYNLTVTATAASNADYTGNIEVRVEIVLAALKNIQNYNLTYAGGTFSNTKVNTITPVKDTDLDTAKVKYSLIAVPAAKDISIDANTGTVTINQGAQNGTFKLTVTATVPELNPDYTGALTSEFNITIDDKAGATAPGGVTALSKDLSEKTDKSLKITWTAGTPGNKPDGTTGAATIYDVYIADAAAYPTVQNVMTAPGAKKATDITTDLFYTFRSLSGAVGYNVVVVAKNKEADKLFTPTLKRMTSNGVKNVSIQKDSFTVTELTVTATDTVVLSSIAETENLTVGNTSVWTSSKPDTATVDTTGDSTNLTILKAGTVTITATLAADPTKTATVIITINKKDIKNYAAEYPGAGGRTVIRIGGKLSQLNNSIPPAANVAYSVNNAAFTVDSSGDIRTTGATAAGEYDIKITATVPSGNPKYTGTKQFEVALNAVETISIKPDAEQVAAKTLFTVGDTDNPAFVKISASKKGDITNQKIIIQNVGGSAVYFNGANTAVNEYDTASGKVITLGIPSGNINLNGVADEAPLEAEVSVTLNGENISRTFSLTKAKITDIYSWRDLDKVRNNLNVTYTLKNNIAFPDDNTYGYQTAFTPIGSASNKFLGKFDGGNNSIIGLKITGDVDNSGLFGYVSGTGAEIKNLVINHKGISGKENVGAVAGIIEGGAQIINAGMISTDSSTVTASGNNAGGLAGQVTGNSKVIGYVTGRVTGKINVGGLAGLTNSSTVTGYATGAVSGSSTEVGGLTGTAIDNSTVTGYATGAVNGTNGVGGLAGSVKTGSTLTGYARGDITVNAGSNLKNFGRLVGYFDASAITITGFHSAGGNESQLALTDPAADASQGKKLYMNSDTKKDFFAGFDFGTDTVGKWIWKGDGIWPAIIIDANNKGTAANVGQTTETKRNGDSRDICADTPGKTAGDVYEIKTEQHFNWIGTCAKDKSADKFKLMNDIAITAAEWIPLGTTGNTTVPFTGSFDGNGKTISGIKITGNTTDFIGLFARIEGAGAEIKNLVLDHNGISGKNQVGALTGKISGGASISNVGIISTIKAKVEGQNNVGGLVGLVDGGTATGYNKSSEVIGNENVGGLAGGVIGSGTVFGYSTGSVSGNVGRVGGLAGLIESSTLTGYATGSVTGNNNASLVGGLAGESAKNSNVSGYARGIVKKVESTNNARSYGKVLGFNSLGESRARWYHSKEESKLLDVSPDYTGASDGIEVAMNGNTAQTAFDRLDFSTDVGKWVWKGNGIWPAIIIVANESTSATIGQIEETRRTGDSLDECDKAAPPSSGNVYQIETEAHLTWIRTCAKQKFAFNFKLMNDITLTPEWEPIGKDTHESFTGNFDGNNKTISGLKITGNGDYKGLFGYAGKRGTETIIKDLVIDHDGISGNQNVSALAGAFYYGCKVINVRIKSTDGHKITGNKFVGGLIGGAGAIGDCSVNGSVTGEVSGSEYVGGMIGLLTFGTITGYTTGTVTGTGNYVGGLVGSVESNGNSSTITGYATGDVSGNENVGGLVGQIKDNSSVVGYSTGNVTGKKNVGGLGGYFFNSQNNSAKGYATGTISGEDLVGGLAGSITTVLNGYSRSKVIRTSGTSISIGRRTGNNLNNSNIKTYYSTAESTVLDNNGNTFVNNGSSGDSITMSNVITDTNFGHFTFGTDTGQWTWVANGQWPAINLPQEVGGNYSKGTQPTAP